MSEQDELRRNVAANIWLGDASIGTYTERADRIIALVRSDMARELLSDDALAFQERRNTYRFDKSLTYGDNVIEQNRVGMNAALAAIGITVEDDQP